MKREISNGGPIKGGRGEGLKNVLVLKFKSDNLTDQPITNLYKTSKFHFILYWLPLLKSMEFAWDIPNLTFEWIEIQH